MGFNNKSYETFVEDGQTAPSSGVEDGAGGGDMEIWSANRQTILTSLIATEWDNNSSYSLPEGVVSTRTNGYETSFDASERDTHSPPSDAEDGVGGGSMSIWQKDRITVLKSLVRGNFTNASSFELPAGLVNADSGYETSLSNAEKNVGINVSGLTRDGSGTPMPGVATILKGGDIIVQKSVSGRYSISTEPPEGVEQGENSSLSSFDYRFDPDAAGFEKFVSGISLTGEKIDALYGSLVGTVTDAEGDPLDGEKVLATATDTGASKVAYTDADGTYKFVGPDGKVVDVEALKESATSDASFQKYTVVDLDFAYSGVLLTVYIPGKIPATGAPVSFTLSSKSAKTDKNGQVKYTKVPVTETGEFTLFEEVSFAVDSAGQGTVKEVDYTTGVGAQGVCADAKNELSITDVDVKIRDEDTVTRAVTGEDGAFSFGGPQTGDVSLVVAEDDERYYTTEIDVAVGSGDIVEEDFTLERRTSVSTY